LAGIDDDSDEEDKGKDGGQSQGFRQDPGSNDYVNVIGPEGEQEMQKPTQAPDVAKDTNSERKLETAKQEKRSPLVDEASPPPYPSNGRLTTNSKEELVESPTQVDEPESMLQPGEEDNDEDLKIPGSFDLSGPSQVRGPGATWGDLFRRLTN
jgi:calcium/calmodulin-dependent protein kinase I